jgi:hypothetical protein
MQADSIHRDQRKYSGYLDAVRKLWGQGGPKAFFRGFTPCMVRVLAFYFQPIPTVVLTLSHLGYSYDHSPPIPCVSCFMRRPSQ